MDAKTVAEDRPGQTKPVGFWEAFWFWVKLGFINFGGPAGQIAIMHRELVEKKRWVSERQYLRTLNFCMLLPGPEAQQVATYIGWRLHGTLGAYRGRFLLRDPVHLRAVAPLVPGCSPLRRAGDHGAPLRDPACGDSHRRRSCPADRQACPQPLPAHRLLGRGVRRPLLFLDPFPPRGASRRPRWGSPEPRGA